jgi:hypothetical protein
METLHHFLWKTGIGALTNSIEQNITRVLAEIFNTPGQKICYSDPA